MSDLYQQWVNDNQDQAWSLASYLLKDASEAEDVVQEAFVKLWQHQESIDPLRVTAWLMTVTRNLCFDRIRKKRPNERFIEQAAAEHHEPSRSLHTSQLGTSLTVAIQRLKEPYRSMIVLRDIQQQSYDVVANTTNMSLSQVKTNLHRTRKQLRAQLQELRP